MNKPNDKLGWKKAAAWVVGGAVIALAGTALYHYGWKGGITKISQAVGLVCFGLTLKWVMSQDFGWGPTRNSPKDTPSSKLPSP